MSCDDLKLAVWAVFQFVDHEVQCHESNELNLSAPPPPHSAHHEAPPNKENYLVNHTNRETTAEKKTAKGKLLKTACYK